MVKYSLVGENSHMRPKNLFDCYGPESSSLYW